jgi:hypothetical protein
MAMGGLKGMLEEFREYTESCFKKILRVMLNFGDIFP